MQSIKDIYRIGYGPSSSHTIAPMRIAQYFKETFIDADYFEVELFGSLALTGKGHKTDIIIEKILENVKIYFNYDFNHNPENKIILKAFKNGAIIDKWEAYSLGGGSIRIDKFMTDDEKHIYPHNTFDEIKTYLNLNNQTIIEYIYSIEPDLKTYLNKAFNAIVESVKRGLSCDGLLNADLAYYKAALKLYNNAYEKEDYLIAYAYAAAEENASGNIVCCAPTLGSCGIVASCIYYFHNDLKFPKDKLIDALAIGGLFGNLIKNNASISGAIGGCQAEVGSACAMSAAMIAFLNDEDLNIIEYAAEVAIEHHLGLTCDPVKGYVIIPCIERNGAAILRAFDAYRIARNVLRVKHNLVSFDTVIKSMNDTSKKLPLELKETSLGGLALEFKDE